MFEGEWGAPVAVKVLNESLVANGNKKTHALDAAKFWKEGLRLQSLHHANVVRVYGMKQLSDGAPAIVMEKLETTLARYYRWEEIPFTDLVRIFRDISAGLAYIHVHGMIHRDLTTRNVLLTEERPPRAKISDVGVSCSIRGDEDGLKTAMPGTFLYMPPEAKTAGRKARYDEKLDSFSFGVLMMATLVRREPPMSLLEIPKPGMTELERRQSDYNKIPDDHPVKEIIQECLHNDPEKRPTSAHLHWRFVRLGKHAGIAQDTTLEVKHNLSHVMSAENHH